MRTRSAVAGLLLVVAACSSRKDSPENGVRPPLAVSGSAGSAAGSADGAPETGVNPPLSGSAAGSAAPAPEDPAVRAAYRAGMRAGRKATDAKKYAEAITGFDAALVAKPNDSRALGERGYARLLQGTDLAAAVRDLDAAAGGTKDQKLLSTIWFNRGLIHEKRGDAMNATASFAIANLMRPTKAAAAKLAGKAPCPIEVLRAFTVEDLPPLQAASWPDLAKIIPHEDDATPEPEPALPTVIHSRTIDQTIAYAAWRFGDKLFATTVGMSWYGRCPGNLKFELVKASATHLHVSGSEEAMGGHTYMCEGKGDNLVECTGEDDEVSAGTACLGGTSFTRDLVLEIATGKVLFAIEQPDLGTGTAKATLAEKALAIRGKGCDHSEPF